MEGKLIESYNIGGKEKKVGLYLSTYPDGVDQFRIEDSKGGVYNKRVVIN